MTQDGGKTVREDSGVFVFTVSSLDQGDHDSNLGNSLIKISKFPQPCFLNFIFVPEHAGVRRNECADMLADVMPMGI